MSPILSVERTSDETHDHGLLEQGDEGGGRRQFEATRGLAAMRRRPRHSRTAARGEMT